MSTIVFLHAHPDDEASQTSGTMARAVDEGHRVVLVVATNGDHGTVPDDLADGETLVDRRRRELATSARSIGLHRVEWLGYADSGMAGWEQNGAEGALATADIDEAAARVAAVLDDEDADAVVGYDWHGGYGHPDHVAVHRVLHRAADLARRRPRVLESSMNRDEMRRRYQEAKAAGVEDTDWDPDAEMGDGNPLGLPEAELHWRVDVRDLIERKRSSLAAHASQTSDVGMMLAMPPEVFTDVFGHEHYREAEQPDGLVEGWPFAQG